MPDILKNYYGPAAGPLGFPMTDKQAFALDALLKALPRDDVFRYRHAIVEKATTELMPGERADVSWITTEDVDRDNEVVLSRGMNDSQFQLNPLVTLQHCYWQPPVGKSLWRKKVKDGAKVGVKAKTQYPQKPDAWPDDAWPPDVAFTLVQNQLLNGKSIGFLPVKVHAPSSAEIEANQWAGVDLVIDEWVLLEYACCYLPCQQNAVVEAVSKSAAARGLVLGALGKAAPVVGFTTLDEIERAITRRFAEVDMTALARKIAQEHLDRRRGRV